MPFGPPDGADEDLFTPLEREDADLTRSLKRRYAERWLLEANLPTDRVEDAIETVELKVAPDEEPGRRRLRLTSFYTRATYWLYGWDGSIDAANAFIDEAAQLQGANVKNDRRHGPTPWDESPTRRRKRAGRAKS
jgi:hypothetical protein